VLSPESIAHYPPLAGLPRGRNSSPREESPHAQTHALRVSAIFRSNLIFFPEARPTHVEGGWSILAATEESQAEIQAEKSDDGTARRSEATLSLKEGLMRRVLLYICVLLLNSALLLASAPSQGVPRPHSIYHEKDYVYPPEGISLRMAPAIAELTSIDQGEVVTYHSILGKTYTLTEFRGKNVSILLPDSWMTGLTLDERRTLLDRNDILYEHYKELVGEEPGGGGLLRIAMVPESCGYGCAWIGWKGVEVMDADWSLAIAKEALAAGKLAAVYPHEMCHNFDVYFSYLAYLRNHAHAWTAFLDTFIQVYNQQGYPDMTPSELLAHEVRERWDPYYWNSTLTWENAVLGGDQNLEMTHLIWGGVNLRFAQLHGAEAVRGAMQFWKNYKAQNPPPSTAEAKEDLHLEGLAAGVGLNLTCYAKAWRWQASPELQERMANAYGTVNPFCQDGDDDGFSRLTGDLIDNNEFVYPGALELANGIDDDCDGLVDNVVFAEPTGGDFPSWPNATDVPLPSRITGIGAFQDGDYFEFNLPNPGRVGFIFRPSPNFQGWLFLFAADRTTWVRWARMWEGNLMPILTIWRYPTAGAWTFSLDQELDRPGVQYSLDVFPMEEWPFTWGTVLPPEIVDQAYRLALNVDSLPSLPQAPTEVRFWVTGVGFVGAVPYGPTASFDWVPPANLTSGTYGYRAQLFADGTPLLADTSPQYFTVEIETPVTFDSTSQAIRDFLSRGLIDNEGVAQSLLQQLANARKAINNGQTKAGENILEALENHIKAQQGKHIAAGAAQSLLQFIEELEP